MSFVHIKFDSVGLFVEVEIVDGDTVYRLAKRACTECQHWGVNAGQITLHLIAAEGDDLPSPSAVESACPINQIGWSLTRAGIYPGAWLVAHRIDSGAFHSLDGHLYSPQRRPYLLSPFSISHVAHSAFHATRSWLNGAVLRVGTQLFSAASGMENVGVSNSWWTTDHKSRVMDGRQEHDSSVGGHLPCRIHNDCVDRAESGGGTLKEE